MSSPVNYKVDFKAVNSIHFYLEPVLEGEPTESVNNQLSVHEVVCLVYGWQVTGYRADWAEEVRGIKPTRILPVS